MSSYQSKVVPEYQLGSIVQTPAVTPSPPQARHDEPTQVHDEEDPDQNWSNSTTSDLLF